MKEWGQEEIWCIVRLSVFIVRQRKGVSPRIVDWVIVSLSETSIEQTVFNGLFVFDGLTSLFAPRYTLIPEKLSSSFTTLSATFVHSDFPAFLGFPISGSSSATLRLGRRWHQGFESRGVAPRVVKGFPILPHAALLCLCRSG